MKVSYFYEDEEYIVELIENNLLVFEILGLFESNQEVFERWLHICKQEYKK